MTKEEAEALAVKRERHKPRSMVLKRWAAVHNAVKGWHVALVDNHALVHSQHINEAYSALARGDQASFFQHASEALQARCRGELERGSFGAERPA